MPGDETSIEDYPRGWPKKGRASVARLLSSVDDVGTRRTLLRSLEELAGGRPGNRMEVAKLVSQIERMIALAARLGLDWPVSGSVVRRDIPLEHITRLVDSEVDLAVLEPTDRSCTLAEASRHTGPAPV